MHSDISGPVAAVNFSISGDVGTGVTVAGPEKFGCRYCKRDFEGDFQPVRRSALNRLFKKRGMEAESPCCQSCLTLFIMDRGISKRPNSIFIRTQLRIALTVIYSENWKEHEGKIRAVDAIAIPEIKHLDEEINRRLDEIQALSATRNDLFLKTSEIKDQLLRREAKLYESRRREADRVISDPSVRRRIFSRDGFVCVKCRTPDSLSIDHKIPVFHGGGNEDENLMTLCISCNSKKGAKINEEIERAIGMV